MVPFSGNANTRAEILASNMIKAINLPFRKSTGIE